MGVAAVYSDECSSREASDRADLVELPMMERRKVEAMSPDEASRFLEAARKDQYHTLWCVLLSGGLRPSEALALKGEDVDLDAEKIHVHRSLTRRGGAKGWRLVEPKTPPAHAASWLSPRSPCRPYARPGCDRPRSGSSSGPARRRPPNRPYRRNCSLTSFGRSKFSPSHPAMDGLGAGRLVGPPGGTEGSRSCGPSRPWGPRGD